MHQKMSKGGNRQAGNDNESNLYAKLAGNVRNSKYADSPAGLIKWVVTAFKQCPLIIKKV